MKLRLRTFILKWITAPLMVSSITFVIGYFMGYSRLNIPFYQVLLIFCICITVGLIVVAVFQVKGDYLYVKYTNLLLLMACCIIFLLVLFGILYTKCGIVDASGNVTHNFRDCMYFSAVTFTTLGYGDFKPTRPARALAASEAIVGYLCLGLLIAIFIVVIRKQLEKNHKQH